MARGGVVLDAGAGYQRYKPFFDDSIYIAQEHPIAGRQNKDIHEYDILSDVKQIPLRDNCVDLLLSTSSLEHIEFPTLFFSESFRVLKPSGALYIHVPFAYPEHEAPYDFQRITRYGLQSYYSQAGFENITVFPTSSSIYSGQYFFLYSIKEDGKRLAKNAFWAEILRKIMYCLALPLCKLNMMLYDRGPFDDTTLPIGWVAKAYKKGRNEIKTSYSSKQHFITENAQCDDNTFLKDGRILSRL